MADISEVKQLIDNVKYINGVFTNGLRLWRPETQNCSLAVGYKSQGFLNRICEYPQTLQTELFTPLIDWLEKYKNNREGKIAFTPGTLDSFLKRGLMLVYRFTIVADLFIKNPDYLFPTPALRTNQDIPKINQARVNQNKYKEFIILLNERLIGCNKQMKFLLVDLFETVKDKTEFDGIKKYLDDQCLFLRSRKLEISQ